MTLELGCSAAIKCLASLRKQSPPAWGGRDGENKGVDKKEKEAYSLGDQRWPPSEDLRKKGFCGRRVFELEFREQSSMANREARHLEGP